jgi:hypothetical protein
VSRGHRPCQHHLNSAARSRPRTSPWHRCHRTTDRCRHHTCVAILNFARGQADETFSHFVSSISMPAITPTLPLSPPPYSPPSPATATLPHCHPSRRKVPPRHSHPLALLCRSCRWPTKSGNQLHLATVSPPHSTIASRCPCTSSPATTSRRTARLRCSSTTQSLPPSTSPLPPCTSPLPDFSSENLSLQRPRSGSSMRGLAPRHHLTQPFAVG